MYYSLNCTDFKTMTCNKILIVRILPDFDCTYILILQHIHFSKLQFDPHFIAPHMLPKILKTSSFDKKHMRFLQSQEF